MTRQKLNLVIHSDSVLLFKNGVKLYEVSLTNKTINIKDLYEKMGININEEYFLDESLKKYEPPKNDSERIFNNVYDFILKLLEMLNKKIKEINEKKDESIFK